MKVVNNKRSKSYKIPIVLAFVSTIAAIVLRVCVIQRWSVGMLVLALVLVAIGQEMRYRMMTAYADSMLLEEPMRSVKKLPNTILYNDQPLVHYKHVYLTHEAEPYADARTGILWLHPEHFNVSARSKKIWEDAGGITTT